MKRTRRLIYITPILLCIFLISLIPGMFRLHAASAHAFGLDKPVIASVDNFSSFEVIGLAKKGNYRKIIEKYANYYNLSKEEQKIYRVLRRRAVDIINGRNLSSVVNVSGLFIPKEEFKPGIIAKILSHLEEDYIFEMVWFDKTRNNSYKVIENDGYITSVLVYMGVGPEYCGEGDYRIKWDAIKKACKANKAAVDVVTRGQKHTDYGKISFYINYVKSNAAYDFVLDSEVDGYTNAYKFVNVFNDNYGTKIVCEGCSKALKYLCDMSEFDSDVECIIATGQHHMWDIIKMDDGKNYIFDMTNGQVFKSLPESKEDMDEYDLIYAVYDSKTKARHRASDLKISNEPYA